MRSDIFYENPIQKTRQDVKNNIMNASNAGVSFSHGDSILPTEALDLRNDTEIVLNMTKKRGNLVGLN